MASIFKRSNRKNEPYTIQYVDHQGKRRTQKGFTDKGLTEQLAAKLEGDARLRITGLIDLEEERYAVHKLSPIEAHLSGFKESLADFSAAHAGVTMTRVKRIVAGCAFEKLADVAPEAVQAFLRKLRKEKDLGHRTYNHYIEAMDAFLNWCISTKRLIVNPLAGFERLNTEVDVRRKRRALTADEVGQVVASARSSGVSIQEFTGEERARIYILSYMTGLRKKEIASLTPRSFSLDAEQPTLTVEAAFSKHRRKDVLPLHPELVVMLRNWLRGMAPGEKLFPKLGSRKAATMVRKDLERAGLEYETADGVADFHAAGRHSHITELLRNGATLPEAQKLARHADIKMTMKYTHIGIADQAKAVANLPAPRSISKPVASTAASPDPALHGRCISRGFDCLSVSATDKAGERKDGVTSCRNRELDTPCRRLSPDGKTRTTGTSPTAR